MTETNTLVTDALIEDVQVTIEQPTDEAMEQPTEAVMEPSIDMEIPQEAGDSPEPIEELSEVQKLINKRTGFWAVNLELADLKWIKNQCNSKFEFNGPNEAFMMMNCYLGFASAVARIDQATKMKLESEAPAVQASAIEACALLLNRYTGSGLESAQRVFRIAVALNGSIMEMKELDDQIAKLKQENSDKAEA
jgi:hypothetical protein